MEKYLSIPLLLLLLSCDKNKIAPDGGEVVAILGKNFELQTYEKAVFQDPELSGVSLELKNFHRAGCATCTDVNMAVIELEFRDRNTLIPLRMYNGMAGFGPPKDASTQFDTLGYKIEFADFDPKDKNVSKGEYKAILKISRN